MALFQSEIVVPCGTWFGAKSTAHLALTSFLMHYLHCSVFREHHAAVADSFYILTQLLCCVNILLISRITQQRLLYINTINLLCQHFYFFAKQWNIHRLETLKIISLHHPLVNIVKYKYNFIQIINCNSRCSACFDAELSFSLGVAYYKKHGSLSRAMF